MKEQDLNIMINAVMTNAKAFEAFSTMVACKDWNNTPVETIEIVYRAIFEKQ